MEVIVEVKIKQCSRCKLFLPVSEFDKYGSKNSRLQASCKSCSVIYNLPKKQAYDREYKAKSRNNDMLPFLINDAKCRSKKLNIPFNITKNDLTIPEVCPVLGIKIKHNNFGFKADSISLDRLIPALGYIKGNVVLISTRANLIKNIATIEDIKNIIEYMRGQPVYSGLEIALSNYEAMRKLYAKPEEWTPNRYGKYRTKMISEAKFRAKRDNIPFNLSYNDIKIPVKCPVLGVDLKINIGIFKDNSITLDRFNPKLGYIVENTRVISFRANSIKKDATIEEMEAVLAYMKKHINKENKE